MSLGERTDEERALPFRELRTGIDEQTAGCNRRTPFDERGRDVLTIRRVLRKHRAVVVNAGARERPTIVGMHLQQVELIATTGPVIGEPDATVQIAGKTLGIAHAAPDGLAFIALANVNQLAPMRYRILRARIAVVEVRDGHDELSRPRDEKAAGIEKRGVRATGSRTIDALHVEQCIDRQSRSPDLERKRTALLANHGEVHARGPLKIKRHSDIEKVHQSRQATKRWPETARAEPSNASGPFCDQRFITARKKGNAPGIGESVRHRLHAQFREADR
jgi:hypothetical protein